MPGNMVLNPDFKEFFQLLNANFESLGLQDLVDIENLGLP